MKCIPVLSLTFALAHLVLVVHCAVTLNLTKEFNCGDIIVITCKTASCWPLSLRRNEKSAVDCVAPNQPCLKSGTIYNTRCQLVTSCSNDSTSKEPTICYNEVNLKNSTFGYFICPETNMTDSFDKCCGDSDEQICCDYLEYTAERRQANIIGIVVGVIVGCIVVAPIIYIVIVRRRRAARQGLVIQKQHTATYSQPPPVGQPYGHQGYVEGSIPLNPYTDQPQPPVGPGGFMGTPSGPGCGEKEME